MIHILNDENSRHDHAVVVTLTDRNGERRMHRLAPGETATIAEADGDLVSVFDIPLAEH